VKGKLALIREPDAESDLRQAEFAACPQELLRSFNPARDHILVRRQSGSRLKLPREVIGAEMNDGGDLPQRRTAFEILHDVLDDGAELPTRKYAVR
jgi:hypothetical protein